MSESLRIAPPIRINEGPLTGEALNAWFNDVQRLMLAPQDVRNDRTAFASGVLADQQTGNVTLGTKAFPVGRIAAVPTLVTFIGDTGQAASQRLLGQVTTANRASVQSTDTPLTSVAGATTATINIAAHDVVFDFGTVSYNSGSIAGLALNTVYYVYADDAAYAGGAVTYAATTNPSNLMVSARYYVGSVTTPIASNTRNVSGATLANPTVITTSVNHGWSTADNVSFATMDGGFTALNGNTYAITVIAANTFSIPVDATAFGPYSGAGGTATRVVASAAGGAGAGAGGIGTRFLR